MKTTIDNLDDYDRIVASDLEILRKAMLKAETDRLYSLYLLANGLTKES